MKVQIIANPIAGGGKAPARIQVLEKVLQAHGCEVQIFQTRQSGDARHCAQGLGSDIDRIVVVGGDGTLNEVINGLARPYQIPLTQLPMGTANILARDIGLQWEPKRVADSVLEGEVRRFDLFTGNGRRFLALGSVGFDAIVTRDIMRNRKGTMGLRGYFMPMLRSLRQFRIPKLSISIDDQDPLHGALVIIGNIRNYAGFMHATERARPDSGHLDVCIFPQGSPVALTLYALAGAMRQLGRATNVIQRTGRHVRVTIDEPDPPCPYQLDGDYVGQTPLEVNIEPGVLPFIV